MKSVDLSLLNDKRLKSYYKSLQAKKNCLKHGLYFCDTCWDYHFPAKEKLDPRYISLSNELNKVIAELKNRKI